MVWVDTGMLVTFCSWSGFCFLVYIQFVRFHWAVHLWLVSSLYVHYTSMKVCFKKRKKSRGEWCLVLILGPRCIYILALYAQLVGLHPLSPYMAVTGIFNTAYLWELNKIEHIKFLVIAFKHSVSCSPLWTSLFLPQHKNILSKSFPSP